MGTFKYALVRKPAKSITQGITSAKLGKPIYEKALRQHQAYCDALVKCGLSIIEVDPLPEFPDSVFVEDTAIVTEKCAIIARPGHENRRGEEKSISQALSQYRKLEQIQEPGTLDGGDIMRVEDHFYIGLSDRTNEEGATQLNAHLSKYGYTSSLIEVGEMLHLKSGINYVGNNTLVVYESLHDLSEIKEYEKISIPTKENYAANCVLINDYLLVAKGFDSAKKLFNKAGFNIIELDMSEFEKVDGGLSCLSLRF